MTDWKELAPDIFRQRLIIEATTIDHIDTVAMYDYLTGLTEALQMVRFQTDLRHQSILHHRMHPNCQQLYE